jgi:hypothetical protein
MEDIEQKKATLFEIINQYHDNYVINNELIQELIVKHKNYLYIMENLKLSVIYKWNELKDDYKKIKSNIMKNDKLYYNIIKIYGNIIIYFDFSESKTIEKHINDINCKKNNNIIALKELSIIHKDVSYLHNLLIRNKGSLTITIYSTKLDNILNELLSNTKKLNKSRSEISYIIKKILTF